MMEQNYKIKVMTQDELQPFFDKCHDIVFEDDHSYSKSDLFSENDKIKRAALTENMGKPFCLHLGAFDSNDNFVGWSWGFQENSTTYYMCNSGVLEDHRKKGIYNALLRKSINVLSDMGFQLIYSRHCATNNAVIIPKLKAGFVISKMELSDVFGVLVHLHYYTNKTRKKIMDYRSGQLRPDDEIKKVFKL
ncbi:MAG: GNAT family N-acetyltransferase [Bacteriovoracaceae bacterium]|nr:GNAT family N-acetyltransferase [Bacteriovoracaceae bacterium]